MAETHATVSAWVVRKGRTATALLVNHAMPRHPIHTELVTLRLAGAPEPCAVYVERIDEDHANPRRLWEAMGKPRYLDVRAVEALQRGSVLVQEPHPWVYTPGAYTPANLDLAIALPPHGIAAITVEFA